MQRKSNAKSTPASSTGRRWIIAAVLLFFAMAAGAAAWHFTHPGEDPEVTKAIELQAKLFSDVARQSGESRPIAATPASTSTSTAALSPSEREQVAAQLREQMEKLTEEQRREVREGMGDAFRERMRAMVDAYHALPKEQRAAYLDKEIDRWEKRRQEFSRGGNRDRQGNREAGRSTGGGGQPGGGGNAGGGDQQNRGPRGDGSPEARNERRRERLANSTPEDRAKFSLFFSDMNERRKARGLEQMGPGRR